jgi:hypothetical protein
MWQIKADISPIYLPLKGYLSQTWLRWCLKIQQRPSMVTVHRVFSCILLLIVIGAQRVGFEVPYPLLFDACLYFFVSISTLCFHKLFFFIIFAI